MAKRKGSSAPSCSLARTKVDRDAREAESTYQRRLDKLPKEVWEKIFDDLDENDLFPLALSCRYFRQKQKELVARNRQNGPESGEPPLALTTSLLSDLGGGKPVSADYLRFLSEEKVPSPYVWHRDRLLSIMAAFQGHLPVLQELLRSPKTQLKLPRDSFITDFAARGGQLETLQWLKTQEGVQLDERVFSNMCAGGHLEKLRWLRSEGCPWDEEACAATAWHGDLEILKWLRSEGCPWDEMTCLLAASAGHLDVLKYARENGCPGIGRLVNTQQCMVT